MSLPALLDSPLVLRLGWAILHSLWEILAVALLLALVLPVLRRSGPRAAYAGCCLALALCLTLPTMTFFMGPPPQSEARDLAGNDMPIAGQSLNAVHSHIAGDQTLESPAGADFHANREVVFPASEAAPLQDRVADLYRRASASIIVWVPWLVVVWTVGVLALSVWNCAGWLAVLRLKSTGTSQVPRQVEEAAVRLAQRLRLAKTVRLLQSALVESPVVIGAWKPVILLPAALAMQIAPDQLEALLAHELAHVLRRDYLVNLLQTAVETLLFYHPGVWWISAQVRRERENCCDDLALRLASDRAVYVKALAAVAGARTPSMAPAASGGQLLARLHRILGISRPERGHPARWLTGVAMLSLCGIVAALSTEPARMAAADPESAVLETPVAETPAPVTPVAESPPGAAEAVNMLCVDAEGKPVAGAEVYLFQYSGADTRYRQFGPFTSDEQGNAVCNEAVFSNDVGNFDRWIYARVPNRLVGVGRCSKFPNGIAFNAEGHVKLQASRRIEGHVSVPEGFDCTQVTVRVRSLEVRTGLGDFESQSFPRNDLFLGLDTALPSIFERRPDASGRIQFDDVPVHGALYLATTGDGLAEAQWRNERYKFDQPIQLTIRRESAVAGRVLTPDGKPAVGQKIAARLSPNFSQVFFLSSFRAVTDESGNFTIRGLPQIKFELYAEDPERRWTFRPLEDLVLEQDEVRSVELKMETGVLVSGRVVDPDGNPVAGVGISVVTETAGGPGRGLADTSTDAKGAYQLRIPSGGARMYFNSAPDEFVRPKSDNVKYFDIQPGDPDIENLDFTLQRKPAGTTAVDPEPADAKSPVTEPSAPPTPVAESPPASAEPVNMVCVDAEGKPIAGAEVYLFQYSGADTRYRQFGPFMSDEQGKAVCADAVFTNDDGDFDRWIYARVPDRLVGVGRCSKFPNGIAFNVEGKVKLQPSRSVEGQVSVPEGFGGTQVTVRVRTLQVRTGPGRNENQEFPRDVLFPGLDTALPSIFERRPDASGRIQFDDVPARGLLMLVTTGDGLAEAQWRNEGQIFDQPIQLAIEKESVISGRVLAPDGKPTAGLKIAARISDGNPSRVFFTSTFRAITDERGAFSIRGLPNLEIDLYVDDPLHRWAFRPLELLLVEPDEVRSEEIKMETGILVSGQVVDPDGNPVVAAGVSVVTLTASGSGGRGLADTSTDATGSYQLRIPSGGAQMYFNSVPDGFTYPKPNYIKFFDVQPGDQDIENLDFTLQRKPAGEP